MRRGSVRLAKRKPPAGISSLEKILEGSVLLNMIPLSKIDVSPAKEKQFEKKHITCVEDLVTYFPRKYQDFRTKKKIKDLMDGDICRIDGVITRIYDNSKFSLQLDDGSGYIYITWFGGCFFKDSFERGALWTFCGKISFYNGQPQMVQPVMVSQGEDKLAHIHPYYPKVTGMSDKYLSDKINASLSVMAATAIWTEKDAVAKAMGLMERVAAYQEMHKPTDGDSWKKAKRRMNFEQIYDFYEELFKRRRNKAFVRAKHMPQREAMDAFVKSLPFELTADQSKAVEAIYSGMNQELPLNALVSGDVGCGKTAVALIAALIARENGGQTIIMAPTLVLAKQHYDEMSKLAGSEGIALLTSETKGNARKKILEGLVDGSINILIGTHAVLSPELQFHNLVLSIVDEEHRFGTVQKSLLAEFDKAGTHHLSMTATPIPRSYASSVYGDCLDIITIQTMPKGRKPVITTVNHNRPDVYRKLLDQVKMGHQAYIVCPFIEDSESDRCKDVLSVKTVVEEVQKFLRDNAPMYRAESISGDMKQKNVLAVIDQFARNEVQILVSTTIVEVGVNVPNATAIAIMNADRFGLAALHQLRGRVGRKGDQGYCCLVSDISNEKLAAMTMFSSGFKIAEVDMQLRGPGDILGNEQTGGSQIVDLILRYPKLAAAIRNYFQTKE